MHPALPSTQGTVALASAPLVLETPWGRGCTVLLITCATHLGTPGFPTAGATPPVGSQVTGDTQDTGPRKPTPAAQPPPVSKDPWLEGSCTHGCLLRLLPHSQTNPPQVCSEGAQVHSLFPICHPPQVPYLLQSTRTVPLSGGASMCPHPRGQPPWALHCQRNKDCKEGSGSGISGLLFSL